MYSIISDPSSALETLKFREAKLSSSGAIKLFTALSENKKLRYLDVSYNDITDQACDAIVMAMKRNTSLVDMSLNGNPISGESVQLIVQALQENSNLQQLLLPYAYSKGTKMKIRLSADKIMRKENLRECLDVYNFKGDYIFKEYIEVILRDGFT